MGPAKFPTGDPSELGIDPVGLADLIDAIEADPVIEPHGLIVQHRRRRVLETYWAPHRAGELRLVYSLSKSFTGVALGLAVGDGLLSLDDLVVDHLPEMADGVDERTARMRIRHLASLSTGHRDETLLPALLTDPTDIVGSFLHLPPENDPGTWFAYNQPPVLALSTILTRVTGRRLHDQLRERVLDPIGIGDLRWTRYQPGVDVGFSGVFTDLDAIARLGQLHLDDGCWDGRRILPEGWVAQASAQQIDTSHRPEPDWSRGYGFQLWRCRHGYRGDGAFGQYMVVLPDQDVVVAFFSHGEPMQRFMDHLWRHLLPAVEDPAPAPAPGSTPNRPPSEEEGPTRDAALPTASERTGATGGLDSVTDGRFTPAVGSNHPSITALEIVGGALVVHEGDHRIQVPLRRSWTDVPGHPFSASAGVDQDGSLHLDLVVRCSPHRLEVVVDPATATFRATWPAVPLFGLGLDGRLARMAPPSS